MKFGLFKCFHHRKGTEYQFIGTKKLVSRTVIESSSGSMIPNEASRRVSIKSIKLDDPLMNLQVYQYDATTHRFGEGNVCALGAFWERLKQDPSLISNVAKKYTILDLSGETHTIKFLDHDNQPHFLEVKIDGLSTEFGVVTYEDTIETHLLGNVIKTEHFYSHKFTVNHVDLKVIAEQLPQSHEVSKFLHFMAQQEARYAVDARPEIHPATSASISLMTGSARL